MFVLFSVFYILLAAVMVVLILLQHGPGADAGASFGGGASGAQFGASSSDTFLSRSTYVLGIVFFLLSLGMAIYLARSGAPQPVSDLGLMSGVTTTTDAGQPAATTAPAAAPKTTTDQSIPAAAASATDSDVPSATVPGSTGTNGQ